MNKISLRNAQSKQTESEDTTSLVDVTVAQSGQISLYCYLLSVCGFDTETVKAMQASTRREQLVTYLDDVTLQLLHVNADCDALVMDTAVTSVVTLDDDNDVSSVMQHLLQVCSWWLQVGKLFVYLKKIS